MPLAVSSIIDQTEKDWECLVMNDGSSDRTAEILERTAFNDPRFRLFYHSQSAGLTESLRELAGHARGEFFMRQDADDWSDPDRLSAQIDWIDRHPQTAAAGSFYNVHDEMGRYLNTVTLFESPYLLRRWLRHRNPFAHGSLLLRKSAYQAAGGYRSEFPYAQDYDLLLRLSERHSIGCVPRVLYHWRLSEAGISRSKLSLQSAYADVARRTAHQRETSRPETFGIPAVSKFADHSSGIETSGPVLIHLLLSGQADAARDRIAGFSSVKKRWKWLLISYLPTSFFKSLRYFKRVWELC